MRNILQQVTDRSESLWEVLSYLRRRVHLTNVQRLLVPVDANRVVREAAEAWIANWEKELQKVPKTWKRALKDAGISFRHIYDLRATFSSRMNAAGVPEVFVEQLLGHTGGLTQVYAKAIDEFRRDAIKKLEEFVRSRPSAPTEQKTGGYIQ